MRMDKIKRQLALAYDRDAERRAMPPLADWKLKEREEFLGQLIIKFASKLARIKKARNSRDPGLAFHFMLLVNSCQRYTYSNKNSNASRCRFASDAFIPHA